MSTRDAEKKRVLGKVSRNEGGAQGKSRRVRTDIGVSRSASPTRQKQFRPQRGLSGERVNLKESFVWCK